METPLRMATFNLENLDADPSERGSPTLTERINVLQPQLKRLRADVLCLQEIHGQEHEGQPRQLSALSELLAGTRYEDYHLATTKTSAGQPYDKRNLVILSRFPITAVEQIKHQYAPKPRYQKVTALPEESEAKDVTWERPALRTKLDLENGRNLNVLNVHLKSKIPSKISGQGGQREDNYRWNSVEGWAEGYFISSMKRVGQALEVRRVLDSLFDEAEENGETPFVAICGDFNAPSDSVPMNAIRGPLEETNNPELGSRIMVPCEMSVPEPSRYTLLHLGRGEMLDHVLVSRPLLEFYRGSEIHNEVLPDESGAYRTDQLFPESDHAPVVSEFVFQESD